MKRAYLVSLCLLVSALYAQPQPAFTPFTATSIFMEAATYHSGGYSADSIAVADLNGDGHPDLVVANSCASASSCRGRVGVLLGNGDGTYQPPVSYSSGGYQASSIAVADVNGDGFPDLLVTNSCANSACLNGSVSVLLGNGDGTFRVPVSYNSGGYEATSVAVADVNGDGFPDLVVTNSFVSSTNQENGTVAVLLGKGNGTFQAPVTYNSGGYGATFLALADVNGDGYPDVLATNQCGPGCSPNRGELAVLLGNGNGTFQAPVMYDSGGYDAWSVAIADVNRDGIPDLLVSNLCGEIQLCEGSVGVLLGNGDGTFGAATSYDTGGYYSRSVAVADVDHHGSPGLVVASSCLSINFIDCSTFGVVSVLAGNGDGTFQAPEVYNSGGRAAFSVAIADVNGDGRPDVVVANLCFSIASYCQDGEVGGVSVLLGEGKGKFHAARSYNPGGHDAISIAVADVNGDGHPDLIVANQCVDSQDCLDYSTVGVLLGNGDGTFQPAVQSSSGGEYTSSVAVADVNGDGYPDLVVASQCVYEGGCGVVSVLLGKGNGTFQDPVTYSSGGNAPSWVAIADVNGDGYPDLLVANGENIGVLLNNGDGTFATAVVYGSGASSIAAADVNGDGYPDLIVADSTGVGVLLNNGDGTFQAPVNYNSGGSEAYSIALADVNGDGITDILVANGCISTSDCAFGTLGVLLGKGDGTFRAAKKTVIPSPPAETGQIAVADFNGNGKLDVAIGSADVLLLGNGDGTFQNPHLALGVSGPGTAAGDFNGDGRPDLAIGDGFYGGGAGGVTVLLNIAHHH